PPASVPQQGSGRHSTRGRNSKGYSLLATSGEDPAAWSTEWMQSSLHSDIRMDDRGHKSSCAERRWRVARDHPVSAECRFRAACERALSRLGQTSDAHTP